MTRLLKSISTRLIFETQLSWVWLQNLKVKKMGRVEPYRTKSCNLTPVKTTYSNSTQVESVERVSMWVLTAVLLNTYNTTIKGLIKWNLPICTFTYQKLPSVSHNTPLASLWSTRLQPSFDRPANQGPEQLPDANLGDGHLINNIVLRFMSHCTSYLNNFLYVMIYFKRQ